MKSPWLLALAIAACPAAARAQSCPGGDSLLTGGGGSSSGDVVASADAGSGGTSYLTAMASQSWGEQAIAQANQIGVNPSSLAAIGQVESGFQNVGTANGSSSATGPFQITQGTFNGINQQYGLGFSPSQISDPNAQAVVAPYILSSYAQAVSAATGQPATTLQAYSAYVFGPSAGAQISNATDNTPLSSIVSAKALSNNGMSAWSVGDFRSKFGSKLGGAANQTVMI